MEGGALMMMRGISLPLGNTGLGLGSDLCLWLLLHICVCVSLLRPTTKRMFACSGASVTHRGICATPPVDGQSVVRSNSSVFAFTSVALVLRRQLAKSADTRYTRAGAPSQTTAADRVCVCI